MTALASRVSRTVSATVAAIPRRQRWVAGGLALAVFLIGLTWVAPWNKGVPLLTGDGSLGNGLGPGAGCYTNSAEGPLVIDATYGTAIIDKDGHATVPAPIMWRPGYTARQAGSEIEVLDPSGQVVAITGRSYRIEGGYVGGGSPLIFYACGFVTPQ